MPADHRQDRRTITEGSTPIALQEAPCPVEILNPKRAVQSELLGNAGHVVLGHARIQPILRQRSTWNEVQDHEADDGDHHEQHDALGQSVDQEAAHWSLHL